MYLLASTVRRSSCTLNYFGKLIGVFAERMPAVSVDKMLAKVTLLTEA
jgi:hypothetical protein